MIECPLREPFPKDTEILAYPIHKELWNFSRLTFKESFEPRILILPSMGTNLIHGALRCARSMNFQRSWTPGNTVGCLFAER